MRAAVTQVKERVRSERRGRISNPVDLFFVESEVGFGLLRLPTLGTPGISFGAPGILPGARKRTYRTLHPDSV